MRLIVCFSMVGGLCVNVWLQGGKWLRSSEIKRVRGVFGWDRLQGRRWFLEHVGGMFWCQSVMGWGGRSVGFDMCRSVSGCAKVLG